MAASEEAVGESQASQAMVVDETSITDRQKFEEVLRKLMEGKNLENSNYITAEMYANFLAEYKVAKAKKKGRDKIDWRRLKRFAICVINGEEKLIEPVKSPEATMRFYVTTEEFYDIIRAAHITNHLSKHANIPREARVEFVKLCPTCATKRTTTKKGLTVRPMVYKAMNDRWQVDLVDWQSSADGDFKWIMVVQGHLAKFIWLRALKSKQADEVAKHLVDIVLTFGAPSILQADNGREFRNQTLQNLRQFWPNFRMVHGKHAGEWVLHALCSSAGKPRHSQGSVERLCSGRRCDWASAATCQTTSSRTWRQRRSSRPSS